MSLHRWSLVTVLFHLLPCLHAQVVRNWDPVPTITDSVPPALLPGSLRAAIPPRTRPTPAAAPALQAFPNPARDQIHIALPPSATEGVLECVDAQGRLLRSTLLTPERPVVDWDVRGWPQGLYLVRHTAHGLRLGQVKFTIAP